ESAAHGNFARWVSGDEWGPLEPLAASFNWLQQEVQARLKSLEAGLADETARLEALVHAIPDGVIMANLRGEVLYVNAPAARMLAPPGPDLSGGGGGVCGLFKRDGRGGGTGGTLERGPRHDVVELAVGSGHDPNRVFISSVQMVSNPDMADV